MKKVFMKGPIFNPTGISTANREMAKSMKKLCEVEVEDVFRSGEYTDLKNLTEPIDMNGDIATIFTGYPTEWSGNVFGEAIGHPIHEGTKIPPEWLPHLNKCSRLYVCSQATKNLFKWAGVIKPIKVISYGYDPELYNPKNRQKPEGAFIFMSVNSWTGDANDRKGTDILIKAFDEEFKNDPDVKLLLKVGTFWQGSRNYAECAGKLLGHMNDSILVNQEYVTDKELASYYHKVDCFVAPTRGEGFGLTILNSLASGVPVIVTDDDHSGHMDFCKDNPGAMLISKDGYEQGDPRFFIPGNKLAQPSIASLRKAMRYAFEHRDEIYERGLEGAEKVKDLTWDNQAKKIVEWINEPVKV